MTDLSGRALGHYRVESVLGQGGMGEVYRALDTTLGRYVALKVLPGGLARSERALKRFEREARALASLSHPGIVTIHSVEFADDIHFLTMELIEGQSLGRIIPPGGMPLGQLLDVAAILADAVRVAHAHGLIHRDLKPANIMVTREGAVKVLDFGLAQLTRSSDDETTIATEEEVTRAGEMLGTPGYISPEQTRGLHADARSDVFALGVVLYQMATGTHPFPATSPLDHMFAIVKTTERPASELRPELPRDLDAILSRCLAKDPDQRYPDAGALAQALQDLRMQLTPGSLPSAGRLAVPLAAVTPARRWRRRLAVVGSAVGLAVLAVATFLYWPRQAHVPRIVVLPFESIGPVEQAYFAAGICDEITSRLAGVSGLGVVSRTTALAYDRRGKTVASIGGELGVDWVLEGSVRHDPQDPNRVVVTPQLIRVADDTHVWADRFERRTADALGVQAEIAGEVVRHLGVAVSGHERRRLETAPTVDPGAYEAYLMGLAHARRFLRSEVELAVDMFERAVQLDPAFAMAHAELAIANASMYHYRYDTSPERRDRAKACADRALELAPDLLEAHRALGYVRYWGWRDYAGALLELGVVEQHRPNDARTLADVAYIQRRMGAFDDSVRRLEQAAAMEPGDADLIANLGITYRLMRRYEDAQRAYRRAIAAAPDLPLAYQGLVITLWMADGRPERAREVLATMPRQEEPYAQLMWYLQGTYERDWEGTLRRFRAARAEVVEDQIWYYPRPLVECTCLFGMGRNEEAAAACTEAVAFLERQLEAHADDARMHAALGLALALLGRRDEAVAEGEQAVSLCPTSHDAMEGPAFAGDLAAIHAILGNQAQAMGRLERLLAIPSNYSSGLLRLDPVWDRIRDDATFRRLASGN